MMKELFYDCCKKYSADIVAIDSLWIEIQTAYGHKKRFYHTLHHLENLITELRICKTNIKNWDAVLFAVFYHDIVYNVIKKDNEEKSAELGKKRLMGLSVSEKLISECVELILATKKHERSDNTDANYFTDTDLSILGADRDIYNQYVNDIRKEYTVFPDIIYKPGRRKVLQHFLSMPLIFKTEHFSKKLEEKARQNLKKELESLL